MEFSIYKMKETIRSQSNLRCSEDAARLLNDELEDYCLKISISAVEQAYADDRVTVQRQDIEKALEDLR